MKRMMYPCRLKTFQDIQASYAACGTVCPTRSLRRRRAFSGNVPTVRVAEVRALSCGGQGSCQRNAQSRNRIFEVFMFQSLHRR
jgi:hypothetical protein